MKRILPTLGFACLYTVSLAQSTFIFVAGQTFTTEASQRGMVCTDFNSDGNKDIMVGNAYGSNIYMFTGGGNGQFSASPGSPLGNNSGPIYLAPADYNNDGKQDIAVANYNSNFVSVFLKTGPGSYSVSQSITTGNQPYCVDAADFNMDGKMDIVTTGVNSNNVFVLLGNGSGGFSIAPSTPITASGLPYHVSAGFFNQDNFPDFAFISGVGNTLNVYLGNGTGGFSQAPGSPYTTGSQPRTICVKDLNNDGFSDLVIPNAVSNNLSIFLGSATGTFASAPGSPVGVGAYPYQAVVNDFNLDGTQDIIVTSGNGNNLSVLSGLGTGSFSVISGLSFNVGSNPQSICTGDFNGDGKSDLAVSDWGSNQLFILINAKQSCTVTGAFTYTANANGQVNFNSTSTGTTNSTIYTWDFGDNSQGATGTSVSHNYLGGTYTISMTASNGVGCSNTITKVITIQSCTVTGAFTYAANANGQVNFNSTSTGTTNSTIYTWDFGDNSQGATGTSVSHNYLGGTYTISMTASNGVGCSDTITKVITIEVIHTGISENGNNSSVTVYPNPTNGLFEIDSPVAETKTDFIMYSVLGQEVYRTVLSKKKSRHDLSNLSEGLYYYSLLQDGQPVKTGQIFVNK